MTLTKASENLKADLMRPGSVDKLDFRDAERLGIEALSFIESGRKGIYIPITRLLPGETEE